MKTKRIFAIIGIVLLLGLYILTFVSSLFKSEFSYSLFMASLYSSIAIPILIYFGKIVYERIHKKDKTD